MGIQEPLNVFEEVINGIHLTIFYFPPVDRGRRSKSLLGTEWWRENCQGAKLFYSVWTSTMIFIAAERQKRTLSSFSAALDEIKYISFDYAAENGGVWRENI